MGPGNSDANAQKNVFQQQQIQQDQLRKQEEQTRLQASFGGPDANPKQSVPQTPGTPQAPGTPAASSKKQTAPEGTLLAKALYYLLQTVGFWDKYFPVGQPAAAAAPQASVPAQQTPREQMHLSIANTLATGAAAGKSITQMKETMKDLDGLMKSDPTKFNEKVAEWKNSPVAYDRAVADTVERANQLHNPEKPGETVTPGAIANFMGNVEKNQELKGPYEELALAARQAQKGQETQQPQQAQSQHAPLSNTFSIHRASAHTSNTTSPSARPGVENPAGPVQPQIPGVKIPGVS